MEMSTPANSTNLAILGLHPSAYKVRRTPVIKTKWDIDGARGSERMWGQQTHGSWVSWVRQRDLHIMTVGKYSYINDGRFTSLHQDGSDDWTLEIRNVQARDAGVYECQVSTEPKLSLNISLHVRVGKYSYINDGRFTSLHQDGSDDWTLEIRNVQARDAGVYECQVSTEPKLSLNISLHVRVSKASIPGGPLLYLQSGSPLNLTCVVSDSTPPYVQWYHNNVLVPAARRRSATSLLILAARPADSGNYSCVAPSTDPANITVLVLNGELMLIKLISSKK
ncbi:hypothetical protein LAZ67_14003249 [Cordylochernes scorpioides]|uniref:Ig-like domain-containing protein n=1 Tax=Cordylochernes scorpioides TaxID=51811 RepID=A0ABY6L7F4_9ARAC|nr:hypothetical protein LAZ67_14003249 [Cordylochernes scorpioides]